MTSEGVDKAPAPGGAKPKTRRERVEAEMFDAIAQIVCQRPNPFLSLRHVGDVNHAGDDVVYRAVGSTLMMKRVLSLRHGSGA